MNHEQTLVDGREPLAGVESSSPAGTEPGTHGRTPAPLPLVALSTDDIEHVRMEARRGAAIGHADGFAVIVIAGADYDDGKASTLAVRVPTATAMNVILATFAATMLEWPTGAVAAEVARTPNYSEVVDVPTSEEHFDRDRAYCDRWDASGGVLVWHLPIGRVEAWGGSIADHHGGDGCVVLDHSYGVEPADGGAP